MGTWFLFAVKNALKLDNGDGMNNIVSILTQKYHLKMVKIVNYISIKRRKKRSWEGGNPKKR